VCRRSSWLAAGQCVVGHLPWKQWVAYSEWVVSADRCDNVAVNQRRRHNNGEDVNSSVVSPSPPAAAKDVDVWGLLTVSSRLAELRAAVACFVIRSYLRAPFQRPPAGNGVTQFGKRMTSTSSTPGQVLSAVTRVVSLCQNARPIA